MENKIWNELIYYKKEPTEEFLKVENKELAAHVS